MSNDPKQHLYVKGNLFRKRIKRISLVQMTGKLFDFSRFHTSSVDNFVDAKLSRGSLDEIDNF